MLTDIVRRSGGQERSVVNVFVSDLEQHVWGFRDTGLVCTDTSYVTHSQDKDGWEIGGIFALISPLHYNQTSPSSHKEELRQEE